MRRELSNIALRSFCGGILVNTRAFSDLLVAIKGNLTDSVEIARLDAGAFGNRSIWLIFAQVLYFQSNCSTMVVF